MNFLIGLFLFIAGGAVGSLMMAFIIAVSNDE